ncbi:hypothetical protein GOODEAATRI_029905, partial [Goodea atripinnis]
GILGVVLFSTATTLPCCVFLFINLTMLYTLRSKEVFRDTSRYVLLFNLLFADTIQLTQSQTIAFTYFLFVLGGVTVTFTYTGIMVAAHSASTDKASASRAQRTLLLHLLQMGLTMSSTIHNSLLIVITSNLDRVPAVRLQVVLYVCVIVLPKCLSSLIYGLRDQTIRPILMLNLICQWRGSVFIPDVSANNKIRVHI